MLVFLMILSLPLNNMVLENEKVTVSNLTLTPVPVFFSHRDVKAFNSRTHLFREWVTRNGIYDSSTTILISFKQ